MAIINTKIPTQGLKWLNSHPITKINVAMSKINENNLDAFIFNFFN
jgi:uncharacterized membrane protein YfbV (UPF0208 family)